MKILVIGKNGQVGSALTQILAGHELIALDYPEIDFLKLGQTLQVVRQIQPDVVINAAAYTQVDQAEKEEAKAFVVNAETPAAVAAWCAKNGKTFIHYSTDYVFSGSGTEPHTEEDETGPLNAYGRTKLSGEKMIAECGGNYLVLRTSWVYDEINRNFVTAMLRLGNERDTLSIVNDQVGAPTYAFDLAAMTVEIVDKAVKKNEFPSGVFHLCHAGETTWYNFAVKIFDIARRDGAPLKISRVEAIPSSAYKSAAQRPLNSRLNTEKIRKTFGLSIPHWESGLQTCMQKIMKRLRVPSE